MVQEYIDVAHDVLVFQPLENLGLEGEATLSACSVLKIREVALPFGTVWLGSDLF